MSFNRRLCAAVSGAALTLGALAVAPVPTAGAATAPTADAGTWLATTAVEGIIQGGYPDSSGTWQTFADYGTTGDALISFDAAGIAPAGAAQMRAALDDRLASWTTGVDFGSSDVYAGSTGKALVFTQTAGGGAGNAQLLTQLEGTVQPSGRIQDTTSFADSANTIGQAFAARGLFTAHSEKGAAATRFLLEQQCAAGFFRLYFNSTDTECDSETNPSPDTDVTAYAVLSLADQRSTPEVREAIDDALDWLESTQRADGSFVGGASTDVPNANSTGLAGWALGAMGHATSAGRAATWVKAHQLTSGPDAGAIAYNDEYLANVTPSGIDTVDEGYWKSATAQALPALNYLPVVVPISAGPSRVSRVWATPARSAHRGFVKLRVAAGPTPFAGKATVRIGKRRLVARFVGGTAKLPSRKVFRGHKKVRARVSFGGSPTVAAFSKRVVLKARRR